MQHSRSRPNKGTSWYGEIPCLYWTNSHREPTPGLLRKRNIAREIELCYFPSTPKRSKR